MDQAALLQMIQQGGETTDLEQQMAQQLAQAKMLRTGAPEMSQVGAVARAPSWLAMLGALAQNKSAADNTKAARGNQQQINAIRQQQMAEFMRMLQSQQDPAQGQPVGPGLVAPRPPQPGQLGGM